MHFSIATKNQLYSIQMKGTEGKNKGGNLAAISGRRSMVSSDQYQLINAKDWKIEESWYLTHGILLFVKKKEGITNDRYKSVTLNRSPNPHK
jgi:hypothetical protein